MIWTPPIFEFHHQEASVLPYYNFEERRWDHLQMVLP
jgi:hypothetical protein